MIWKTLWRAHHSLKLADMPFMTTIIILSCYVRNLKSCSMFILQSTIALRLGRGGVVEMAFKSNLSIKTSHGSTDTVLF